MLSPSLVRLEFSPHGLFQDARSSAVWNRALPVPPFSLSRAGAVTTLDTGAVQLTHTDDGGPFSDASLSILRRTPALWDGALDRVWTPSRTAASDPGQLYGTLHNLDGHSGFSVDALNCSIIDPNAFAATSNSPCDFGLLSKGGFALIDDSWTPVWDEAAGWLAARPGVMCGSSADAPAEAKPCFPGGQDTSDADFCVGMGCCPTSGGALSLWYSASRDDHFTDSLNCSVCGGIYTFIRTQGGASPRPAPGLVPLNLYWNPLPSAGVQGVGKGDNVASTFAPTQPGYAFVRVMGYVGDPAAPAPPDSVTLKLYYLAGDHWTTADAADEAAAVAAGYALVGVVGYAQPPPPSSAPPRFACAAPNADISASDAYLFAHGSNYSGALADYVAIAGPVALPRRHWLGVSWSTWDESNDATATLAQVAALVNGSWPLDSYIFGAWGPSTRCAL